MGIRENFSQAVKDLWKKDSFGKNSDEKPPIPVQQTELERYLSEQNADSEPAEKPQPPKNSPGEPQDSAPPIKTEQEQESSEVIPTEQNIRPAVNNSQPAVKRASSAAKPREALSESDEISVISKNTVIEGNIRCFANLQIDGIVNGNVESTRDVEISGKVVGDITCNNASLNAAAVQGNINIKGKLRMDRDTILIGDVNAQYADINGRIRGRLDIGGKAEIKRDAIIIGDISSSTIAITDGAIIQGAVSTSFMSAEDSRSAIPEKITEDNKAISEKHTIAPMDNIAVQPLNPERQYHRP